MIHLGASFKLHGSDTHLRIVVTEPNACGVVLVCNLTDFVHDPDCACVFEIGEHPKITKKSVIAMRKLCVLEATKIEHSYKNGLLDLHEDFSADLVKRIRDAIACSRDVAPKFKKML